MIDQHYSPPGLAAHIAELIEGEPASVFDPAMGQGALLHAAASRWPALKILGTDIDRQVVSAVRRRNQKWAVSRADVLSASSRGASEVWRTVKSEGVDYVVMNPPFSFRGHGGPTITFEGQTYRATPAIAFLATVLSVAKPRAGLIAILPAGALHGLRDRELIMRIREVWELTVLENLPRGAFRGVAASTVIIKATRHKKGMLEAVSVAPTTLRQNCTCVEIIRGRIPVALADLTSEASGVPWIHTTSLNRGVADLSRSSSRWSESTDGPLVVLPRVGRFELGKIAQVKSRFVLLSDCVFGLRPLNENLEDFMRMIRKHHLLLANKFVGTGAPHMTLGRLAEFLSQLGYSGKHVPAGASLGNCHCGSPSISAQEIESQLSTA